MGKRKSDRAVVFVDGNNWYHFLRAAGVARPMQLSYSRISEKLVGPRQWLATRYYIGALKQDWNPRDYANQRAFLSLIRKDDPRITVHLGRLERRMYENPLARELRAYLESPSVAIAKDVRDHLRALAAAHAKVATLKEKAVDIMLARDLLEHAMTDRFDAAYLLSADGDFTPVVETIRHRGKKLYVASPGYSSQLRQAANAFITLDEAWFADCYR